MRILLISGYHGGSHQAWADGFRRHSAHDVQLLTLPARFWKWRMHGGAVTLARRFLERLNSGELVRPDLILFTDMLDVTTFLALTRRECPHLPAVLYMHENQLTYPLPDSPDGGPMRRQRGERDLHYAFINYASMLAVDKIYFNSEYHRRDLLGALPNFLRHFPEFNELPTLPELEAKSGILPPGIDGDQLDKLKPDNVSRHAPMLIWNQRWEFDKGPDHFFSSVIELADQGLEFKLAVCGERFSREPQVFTEVRERLGKHLVHWGYAEENDYARLLWRASITASTALHEFFGISILEAMYCQSYAVLPRRLSYPQLVPIELHPDCLYDGEDQLTDKLRWAILNPGPAAELGRRLSEAAAKYDWQRIAPEYDTQFEGLL